MARLWEVIAVAAIVLGGCAKQLESPRQLSEPSASRLTTAPVVPCTPLPPEVAAEPTKGPDRCAALAGQRQLNDCYGQKVADAEAAMAATLVEIRRKRSADSAFLARLDRAQKAWTQFFEAEMAAIFPGDDQPMQNYGSMYPMCDSRQRHALFERRTAELRRWLDNAPGVVGCESTVH